MLSWAIAILMTLASLIAPARPPAPHPIRPPAPAVALAGAVIVLDPGHDGGNSDHPEIVNRLVYAGNGVTKPCNTTGTSTAGGYAEHAFTWDLAGRVRAILVARGARVVLTRPNDAGVGPCITTRAAIGNAARAAAVVSIHADGGPSSGRGFHVIEPATSLGGPAMLARSHLLALRLHDVFRSEAGEPYANYIAGGDGLDRRSDLGGLNLSNRPSVFIECANMRNAQDAATLTSSAGRARMAVAIADAISEFVRTGR